MNNNNAYIKRESDTDKLQEGKYEKWYRIVSLENLYRVLYEFESNNLRGIKISRIDAEEYQIVGWKGPAEQCYDTGRSVYYKGNLLAVLDDDNHFIFKDIRICEKTANVYILPVYRSELRVTEANSELFAKLEIAPVLFDCDTLQRDAASVSNQIVYEQEKEEVSIIYTGPFRCIVLGNGTLIRRGVPISISSQSQELIGENNCISINLSAPRAYNYLDLYKKFGAIFLLDNRLSISISGFPEVERVVSLSNTLKKRLRNMIDHKHDYFILQGSDPNEQGSCCPNELIPELDQLIQAGVMSSWSSSLEGTNSCPMTVYAFNGELSVNNKEEIPSFTQNELLRLSIRKYL